MVVGQAEMAMTMCFRPSSMRLAISISPSRVSSSTEPISRMYMRTGSVVRPKSESTVVSAASASSSTSSSLDATGVLAHQQRFSVGSLVIDRDAHVAEGADDAVDGLGVDQVVRQMVVDFAVGQVATVLAQLDQLLEAVAAGFVFLGGHRTAGDQVLGIGLAALAAALGRLQVGRTSPSPSIGSSKPSESLLAFLAGRPGRRPLGPGARCHQVGQLVLGLLGAGLGGLPAYPPRRSWRPLGRPSSQQAWRPSPQSWRALFPPPC